MKHSQNSWQNLITFESENEPYALHRIEVPGGWMYVVYDTDNGSLSSCYVPKTE
jgi:hypothetical protein